MSTEWILWNRLPKGFLKMRYRSWCGYYVGTLQAIVELPGAGGNVLSAQFVGINGLDFRCEQSVSVGDISRAVWPVWDLAPLAVWPPAGLRW
jgi:hypothetical protein